MALVDEAGKTVELQVLVVGGASGALLTAVAAKAGTGETFADPLAAGAAVVYVLGDVKGWKTSFRFHGFGADPWSSDQGRAIDGMARGLDAFIIAAGDPPPTSFAVERVASHWRERAEPRPPVCVLGSDAIAASIGALTGTPPAVIGALEGELFKTIQPLLKAALTTRRT